MELKESCYYYLQSLLYLDSNCAVIFNSQDSPFQLLLVFLVLLQCNLEDKISFYEHWSRKKGVKFESPIFIPSSQFKPCSITFTDVKCQAPNRGAGRTAELLRCFTPTWPTLTTSWKTDVIFPHPDNLNFSPLHQKSKYKGVFPQSWTKPCKENHHLDVMPQPIELILCSDLFLEVCRSRPLKLDIISCKKQLDPFLDDLWVSILTIRDLT